MIPADSKFCYRDDLRQYLELPVEARISHKFSSSFDAEVPGGILHFTANQQAMTPLSVLLPAGLIDEAQEGWHVSIQAERLIAGPYNLLATPLLERVNRPAQIDRALLQRNMRHLYRNLELFGRSSPVHDMVLQRNRPPDSLCGAAELLAAGESDLAKFAGYFGVGEGLTPSFDDFLAAMLLIDRFYGFNQLVRPGDLCERAANRTTRQAVQQYRFAANGHSSRQFEQFAADMTQRQVGAAELVKLMGWGHSSGTDILCGIWYYFSHRVKINVKI
ncbi:MAG: hypothetical protein A2W80_15045 [Candidatus Riflebacteria bacterium GWC2_50_8]|nr:MAG: hypothetical protein A2W80_15045 [Candidatus Riflebacteria bacterium GWC2_50_8]